MTAITQKIPNFIGGISQQPDELKPEGSLREALNVIPDVTDGLRKRAGSRLINPLLTIKLAHGFTLTMLITKSILVKLILMVK